MSIRTRRLQRDYEKVLSELAGSEFVCVRPVSGDPPSHYLVTYRLQGLAWDEATGDVTPIDEHQVDIHLPLGYPKQAPRCVMRTPIWHPNIGDYVCIGDYWSAGVTLVDIIAHIGDMIQYRSYNLRSPVNKGAAVWAQNKTSSFPVGTRSVLPPENAGETPPIIEIDITPGTSDLDIALGPVRDRLE